MRLGWQIAGVLEARLIHGFAFGIFDGVFLIDDWRILLVHGGLTEMVEDGERLYEVTWKLLLIELGRMFSLEQQARR